MQGRCASAGFKCLGLAGKKLGKSLEASSPLRLRRGGAKRRGGSRRKRLVLNHPPRVALLSQRATPLHQVEGEVSAQVLLSPLAMRSAGRFLVGRGAGDRAV